MMEIPSTTDRTLIPVIRDLDSPAALDDAAFAAPAVEDGDKGRVAPGSTAVPGPVLPVLVVAVLEGEKGRVAPESTAVPDPVLPVLVGAVLEVDADRAMLDVGNNGIGLEEMGAESSVEGSAVVPVSLSSTSTYRWSKLISFELLKWLSGRLYTVSLCCVDGSRSMVNSMDSTAVSSSVTDGSDALLVCSVHDSSS